jgi:hypothetical protein
VWWSQVLALMRLILDKHGTYGPADGLLKVASAVTLGALVSRSSSCFSAALRAFSSAAVLSRTLCKQGHAEGRECSMCWVADHTSYYRWWQPGALVPFAHAVQMREPHCSDMWHPTLSWATSCSSAASAALSSAAAARASDIPASPRGAALPSFMRPRCGLPPPPDMVPDSAIS